MPGVNCSVASFTQRCLGLIPGCVLYGIYGGETGTGMGCGLITSPFLCRHCLASAPFPYFIHVPPTLCSLRSWIHHEIKHAGDKSVKLHVILIHAYCDDFSCGTSDGRAAFLLTKAINSQLTVWNSALMVSGLLLLEKMVWLR